MTEQQKDKLSDILRKAQPGLMYPFSQLTKMAKIKEYDPEALKKTLNGIRRRLKKEGLTYLSVGEAIWKSS
jgi:hypothetical protein